MIKGESTTIRKPRHYVTETSQLMASVRNVFMDDVDMVNIECIHAMVNMFENVDEIRGYLRGNIFKYQWRYTHKNGVEDLQKLAVYNRWLMEVEAVIEETFSQESMDY